MKKAVILLVLIVCIAAHILPISNQLWQYDKAIHIATYFALYYIVLFFSKNTPPLSISAQLFTFGIAIEILQAVSGRSADFGDIGANGVGLFVAYYVYFFINKFFYMKKLFTFLMLVCISFAVKAQCHINPDSCALAVKIGSFKVEKGVILLQTAEESNIDYFALETAEGTLIEKQAAKNTPSVYRFAPGKSGIYRVAVVNLDATTEYTKYIQFNASNSVQITRTQEGLQLSEPQDFIVYNVMGQVLKSGYDTEIALPNSGIVFVKVGNLPPLKCVRL